MTVIMVKNRTEWADVLPFGLETVRYDGSLLTLMKIDVYKLQRAVGPRTRILNLCVCVLVEGLKCRTLSRLGDVCV